MKKFLPLVNPFDLQNSDTYNLISAGRKTIYEKEQDKKLLFPLHRNQSQDLDIKKLIPNKSAILNNSVLLSNKQNLPMINTILHNSKVNVSLGQLYQNRKASIFN